MHATPASSQILEDQMTIILLLCVHAYLLQEAAFMEPRTSLNWLSMPPEEWESELWHQVTHHTPPYTLLHSLTTAQPIYLCSNAALDHAKFSTFSWQIHSQQMLWSGNGIVPGHMDNLYSGQSKTFGILTGLHFLSNYVSHFLVVYLAAAPRITILCDSHSVLDHISSILYNSTTYPGDTIKRWLCL